jgi:hypothetical protein
MSSKTCSKLSISPSLAFMAVELNISDRLLQSVPCSGTMFQHTSDMTLTTKKAHGTVSVPAQQYV